MHLAPFPDTPLSPNVILNTAGGNWFPPSVAAVQFGVQFGVGNTSLTGTYNPPPPPTTTIVAVVNMSSGVYEFQFSTPIASFNPGQQSDGFITGNNSTSTWDKMTTVAQTDTDKATFLCSSGTGTQTMWAMLQQLAGITCTNPFAVPTTGTFP